MLPLPSERSLQRLVEGKTLVLVDPGNGAGKTTIVRSLLSKVSTLGFALNPAGPFAYRMLSDESRLLLASPPSLSDVQSALPTHINLLSFNGQWTASREKEVQARLEKVRATVERAGMSSLLNGNDTDGANKKITSKPIAPFSLVQKLFGLAQAVSRKRHPFLLQS